MTNLGLMYFEGRGVSKDFRNAHMWWNIASFRGSEIAAKNRNVVKKLMTPLEHEEAHGLARDKVKLSPRISDKKSGKYEHYLDLTTRQSGPEAPTTLGLMSFVGEGTLQDYVYAHMWWIIAKKRGGKLATNNLSIHKKMMTITQIELAEKLAVECEIQNYQNC